MQQQYFNRLIKPLIFILCLLPIILLVGNFLTDRLGANPYEVLTRNSGEWTLRFLLITLAMTPLRQLIGKPWPLRLRRMLGLFTFFYAFTHMTTYLVLDQFFDWSEIWIDIIDRPFITVGMSAFVLLIPLALTSTKSMMKRLGKQWKRLHRLVYVVAICGVLHFLWLVKADLQQPLIYLALLSVLLGYRLYLWLRQRLAESARQQTFSAGLPKQP